MKSILVVDDEQALVLALQLSLANEGYDVAVASSGEEALARVRQKTPDLIVMDVMMPGMGGIEALRLLRETPATAETPIIIMSGARLHRLKTSIERTEFLYKPFSFDELLTYVQHLLRKK